MEPTIAIIGLGFVGLPLSLVYASKGYSVIGVDTNQQLIAKLKLGQTNICEPWNEKTLQESLIESLQNGFFYPTCSYEEALSKATEIIITVGIPVLSDGSLDYRMFDIAAMTLGRFLKPGMTVLLRSTVPPYTTRNRFKPLLEDQSHLSAGKDFYLGYASERMAEGKAYEELTSMPTPVAGINETSLTKCSALLSKICCEVVPSKSMEVVEMSKVVENLSRDVNIAMVNEYAQYAHSLDIDISQVIAVANTHRRVNLLSPGPGVGGYCIPNAYYYLAGVESRCDHLSVCHMSRKMNDLRPSTILSIAENEVKKVGKDPSSAHFALYGIGMKDYSNDLRLSPSLEIIKLLKEKKYQYRFFDPINPWEDVGRCEHINEFLEGADCLLILNRHDDESIHRLDKIKKLMSSRPVIIDTRSFIDMEKARKKGFFIFRC